MAYLDNIYLAMASTIELQCVANVAICRESDLSAYLFCSGMTVSNTIYRFLYGVRMLIQLLTVPLSGL